ncbi:MAG: ATP-dependent nuclease [Candidatus Izemoplasmataceae bacterium]
MISHVFIKNFKAFKKESIVLGEHTLLVGTNNSGKTTVLEALDVFFNHTLSIDQIRNKTQDVVIECLIDDLRYQKTFSPPHYTINPEKLIGNFLKINHINYFYLKETPYNAIDFMHQYLKLFLEVPRLKSHQDVLKAYPFFENEAITVSIKTNQESFVKRNKAHPLPPLKTFCSDLLSKTFHPHTIIGIDRVNKHIHYAKLNSVLRGFAQSVITTQKTTLSDDYPYTITPLYKTSVIKEVSTLKDSLALSFQKRFLLVEGKYDVPWFEKALKLLNKDTLYRVIPCGGYGNITFIKAQLVKSGFKTITITDGDIFNNDYQLNRQVIELYADKAFINRHFKTNFKMLPKSKYTFFNHIKLKDDVIKKVLSSWAMHHLKKDSEFVKEIGEILADYERKEGLNP